MLTHLFAGLFHKRCALCGKEVHEQSEAAVQRFGKWFCAEPYADLYELDLYEALSTAYLHHARRHGGYVPLSEILSTHFPPRHSRELAPLESDHERCASTRT
jgi:hypothetical protein